MLQSDGFNGKGGKGDYGWLQGAEFRMNPILVPPVSDDVCRNLYVENLKAVK